MGQARSFLTLGGSFFGNQRIVSWVGLCGIGPALAGNVGTGGAFALSREGDQGVDVRGRGSVTPIYTKGGTLYYTDVVAVAPRERSCARRERGGRRSFRAFARGGSGCRRSYARSGPIPLPPRGVVWGRWVDFGRGFKKGDDGLRCR